MVTVENHPEVALGTRTVGKGRVWRECAPAVVIAVAFVPILVLFSVELWSRPHYQFFPLVIPGAAALVWRSCRRLGPLEPGSTTLSTSLGWAAWALLALGVVVITPWFAAVGMLLAALGALLAVGGWRLTRAALPGWAFLWLAIPPPRKYDFLLISKLQNVVSRWSSELLDLAGVYHVMDGNVVRVAGRELLVDQACSGIYSLFTLLIGTIFYVLWVRTSIFRAAVLAAAAVFWVLFGNVVRIVTVVLLSTRWGIDAASGWKHELLGLFMFVVMLGLVLSTDRFTSYLLSLVGMIRWRVQMFRGLAPDSHPRRTSKNEFTGFDVHTASMGRKTKPATAGPSAVAAADVETAAAPAVENLAEAMSPPEHVVADHRTTLPPVGRTWMGSRAFATAFGVLFLPQLMLPGVHWKDVLLTSDVYTKQFATMNLNAMPEKVGPFSRGDYKTDKREWDNSWGEHSCVWGYRGPNRAAAVSLDYQFVEWHELTLCYTGRGWTMISRRVETAPPLASASGMTGPGSNGGGPVVVAEFLNLEGRHGYLVYSLYDRKNRPLDPPDNQGLGQLLQERLSSWIKTGDAGGRDGELLSYQLQTFTEGEAPPTPAERASVFELFNQARAQVARHSQGPRAGEVKP
jgi:exosortase